MKKLIIIVITFSAILGLVATTMVKSCDNVNPMVIENVEALMSVETTPTGVVFSCEGDICLVFDYRNRFLIEGCKAEDSSICEVNDIDIVINIGR